LLHSNELLFGHKITLSVCLSLVQLTGCIDQTSTNSETMLDMTGTTVVQPQKDRGFTVDMAGVELDMARVELDMARVELDMARVELDMAGVELDMIPVDADLDGDGVTILEGDCDDNDPLSFPGNTTPSSGRDYDCNGLVDYQATLRVIVDDEVQSLCINNKTVAGLCVQDSDCTQASGTPVRSWHDRTSETYDFFVHEGENVVALHGVDSSGLISGAALWLKAGGRVIPSRGVAPTEIDDTGWRYDPLPDAEGKLGWCDPYFDDSTWSPAVRAGEIYDNVWITSPADLYGPTVEWIWDSTPANLEDAYFRLTFRLPRERQETSFDPEQNCSLTSVPTLYGQDRHARDPSLIKAHNDYWSAVSVHCCGFREGASEIYIGQEEESTLLADNQLQHHPGDWWSQQPVLSAGEESVALVWADSRDNRNYDRIYTTVWTPQGMVLQSAVISDQANTKNPDISFIEEGYTVVWQTGSGNSNAAYDISWARLDEDGLISNRQLTLIGGPEASQRPKVMAWPHDDADAVVVWEGSIPSDIGERARRGIWAQLFNIDGTSVGEPVLLDPTVDLAQAPIDPIVWPRHISLAVNQSSVLVSWEADYTGDQEVYSRSLGEALNLGELRNLSEDGHASRHPVIKSTDDGFAVMWSDNRTGVPQLTIRSLNLSGEITSDSRLIPTPLLRTFKPDFVVIAPDQYLILFEGESVDEPLHNSQDRRTYLAEVSCP
jgi:hypothetical protein